MAMPASPYDDNVSQKKAHKAHYAPYKQRSGATFLLLDSTPYNQLNSTRSML